jgi:transposase, IS5 family
VPDATTLLKFRRLLEDNGLTGRLFDTVKDLLRERGLLLEKGTLVDATLIAAPSSTKNKETARDPDMHQTRKGQQYSFGAKAHIGADADSGLVPSLECTAAQWPTSPRPTSSFMVTKRTSVPMPATRVWTSARNIASGR